MDRSDVSANGEPRRGPRGIYRARVTLPDDCERAIEVFVNGVGQREGFDFDVDDRDLLFYADLRREGKLGLIRWLSMALAIAGTYRQNDSVDVTYEAGGRHRVATALPIHVLVQDDLAPRGPVRGSYSPG